MFHMSSLNFVFLLFFFETKEPILDNSFSKSNLGSHSPHHHNSPSLYNEVGEILLRSNLILQSKVGNLSNNHVKEPVKT